MTKIVFVPLDERPCNLEYPQRLAEMTDLELAAPPMSILGRKKRRGTPRLLVTGCCGKRKGRTMPWCRWICSFTEASYLPGCTI